MRKLNRKGFTLIELLAVIVIMGVLLLIAIPAVSKYITQSRQKTFVSTSLNLVDAVRLEANNDELTYGTSGKCNYDVTKVTLEKGSKTGFTGYVEVERTTTGYTYKVAISNGTYSIGTAAAPVLSSTVDTSASFISGLGSATSITTPTATTATTDCK